ncbi:ABC transporter permease [Streptomyces sp. MUM 2J]|uniref:ABC transporter permease n=1 Tax=Streptomyces sp. MUM 2J TaxID=2791987 RepID=UPI001F03A949|nr:ABC transporter permease [Streptomyces sp. MUM 2J]MCH0566112.1 ABC transporter permease [Streptomyces sp. MUM 2J]
MTTMPPAPEVTGRPSAGDRPWAAVLALARFEARELLLNIPVLVLLVLYLGYSLYGLVTAEQDGMTDYPVLQNADRASQTAPQLVALAVLLCVNHAVLRSRRHGTDRQFDVLPVQPWRRTLAHALSAVPFAGLVAVVVGAEFAWAASKPGAVGHGSFFELAVAPLSVLLAGVVGALLARLIHSAFAAPLFVVGLYVLLAVFSIPSSGSDPHWLHWLSPVVPESGGDPLPSDLLGRPAAWHALYLVGLTVALLCGAVAASGQRTRTVAVATAVALTATVAGIAGQSPGDARDLAAARATASIRPEEVQSCSVRGTVTYCAFPEWSGRTADWAGVVERVQQLAGGRRDRLTVRQRLEARYGLTSDAALTPLTGPGQVTVGTAWGGNRVPEFAVGVASVLVAGDEEAASAVCDARAVTIMWLALAAQPDPVSAFVHVRLDDRTEGSGFVLAPTDPLGMSAGETAMVRALLDRPGEAVAAAVRDHWAELTSPKTSLTRVAQLLDVKAPEKEDSRDACEA